jgi:hypothetical protein
MTLRSLINFGQALSEVAGINIKILNDDSYDISYCILKKEKNVVAISKFETDINTLSQLEEKLKGNLAIGAQVHINVDGKGILTKTIDASNDTARETELVKKLFPMIKTEEFTIQRYPVGPQIYFDALRNDVVEKFQSLTAQFSIVSISLGPFVVAPLSSVLEGDTLSLDDYTITFAEGKIESVAEIASSIDQQKILIGNDELPANTILAYSSALSLLVPNEDLRLTNLPWVSQSLGEYIFNKKLYVAGRAALIAVLTLLMINALVSFQLQSETQNLVMQESMYAGKKSKTDVKLKKLSGLSAAYKNIGWETNQLPVYYADQIAQKVTPEIQLTLLDIGVIDEKVLKKEKRQVFQPNMIKVKGLTKSPLSLKSWVESVENLGWVKDVFDQKYLYDSKQGKGAFEFYIQIR